METPETTNEDIEETQRHNSPQNDISVEGLEAFSFLDHKKSRLYL